MGEILLSGDKKLSKRKPHVSTQNKIIFFFCQLKVEKHLIWVILKFISLPATILFQLLKQKYPFVLEF